MCLRIVALASWIGMIPVVVPVSVVVSQIISLVVLSLALRSITLPWSFIGWRSLKDSKK